MRDLRGNAVFVQSGPPSAVTNCCLSGAVQAASRIDCFEDLYAAAGGFLGLLKEDLFDLRRERADDLENLKRTPGAALGSCAYLPSLPDDFGRAIEVFAAHNVRFLFCSGGTAAAAVAAGIHRAAGDAGHEMRIMVIPDSAENDLMHTDHAPGYGSAVKGGATAVTGAGLDAEARGEGKTVTVLRVPGDRTGWVAAGTGLARMAADQAPHLIYFPERPPAAERILEDVLACLRAHGRCVIVAAEGVCSSPGSSDPLEILQGAPDLAVRSAGLSRWQLGVMNMVSLTDANEAVECGGTAVRKAAGGQSGCMVTLVREDGPVYRCSCGTVPLEEVAGGCRGLPDELINRKGNGITDALRDRVKPLLKGEVRARLGPCGLPAYVRLARRFIPRKCAQWLPQTT
jgi:6-phosphofructokinase 1